jgi:hypothetical protein
MSSDGRFDAKGLDAVAQSLVDSGKAKTKPDLEPYVTERYLPGGSACKSAGR